MRDIVATIQPDQDDLVRADLDTSLCIQGAPGTGKTAVGLHRAAYLLYTYPDRLRRSGVLVVGPNAPSCTTSRRCCRRSARAASSRPRSTSWSAGAAVAAPSRPSVAVLKGDARMADVLRRAVLRPRRASRPTTSWPIVGTRRYRVGAHHLRRYVDDARRALADGLRWAVARERLRTQVAEDVRRQREDAGGAPTRRRDRQGRPLAAGRASSSTRSGRPCDARALLARLYDDADFLRRCAARR